MRKKITDIRHLKNRILLLVYIFRCLPSSYFETFVSQKEKQKARFCINNLIQQEYLKKKKAFLAYISFLYLTKKGYEYVVIQVLKISSGKGFYTYRTDRISATGDSDHRFMNFLFLQEWITKNHHLINQSIQMYEDSDINKCKIAFSYGNKRILLVPDVLILLPDEKNYAERKAIFVENDTGGEAHKRIYQKLIEYGLFAMYGMKQNNISKMDLYFIFQSTQRTEYLMGEKGTLGRYVEQFNATEKLKDIHIFEIINAFTNPHIHIYYSAIQEVGNTTYSFLPYDFKNVILTANPSWGKLF
jgi:hypothetical protein